MFIPVSYTHLFNRPDAGRGQFGQRLALLDNAVELINVNKAVAQSTRHLVVNMGDDQPGRPHGGQRIVDGNAQAAPAVLVRRRDLYHGDIKRVLAHPVRQAVEKTGSKIGTPLLHPVSYTHLDVYKKQG